MRLNVFSKKVDSLRHYGKETNRSFRCPSDVKKMLILLAKLYDCSPNRMFNILVLEKFGQLTRQQRTEAIKRLASSPESGTDEQKQSLEREYKKLLTRRVGRKYQRK